MVGVKYRSLVQGPSGHLVVTFCKQGLCKGDEGTCSIRLRGGRRHSLSPATIRVSKVRSPQASVCTAKPCDEATAPPGSDTTAKS